MDLVCVNCGEPWEVSYVLHEDPQSFKRDGSLIEKCPCCEENKKHQETLPKAVQVMQTQRLENIRELCELMGDDVDGAASNLEDFGLL